jgi:nitroreductase
MTVSDAIQQRVSVRAFLAIPVPGAVVRQLLQAASRAPSGGNLQPWHVYALSGAPLQELKSQVASNPSGETPEYAVYPGDLWEPLRSRRYQCGEDLYATIALPREDRAGRLRQLARNGAFFGAPVGLFFCVDRRVGPPQWSDVGMYMQTLMLLAVEQGLDTCAQEFWSRHPRTVARALELPDHLMLFAGMALGYRDPDHPVNRLRTRRDPFESWAQMQGFDGG